MPKQFETLISIITPKTPYVNWLVVVLSGIFNPRIAYKAMQQLVVMYLRCLGLLTPICGTVRVACLEFPRVIHINNLLYRLSIMEMAVRPTINKIFTCFTLGNADPNPQQLPSS